MTRILAAGCIGFGLVAASLAVAQERQTTQQAIQWEHSKDAAAARQAALEAQHSSIQDRGPARTTASSADREDMSQAGQGSTFRTEPTAAELQQAVAWEHHKDTTAARQSSVEARTHNGEERGSK